MAKNRLPLRFVLRIIPRHNNTVCFGSGSLFLKLLLEDRYKPILLGGIHNRDIVDDENSVETILVRDLISEMR